MALGLELDACVMDKHMCSRSEMERQSKTWVSKLLTCLGHTEGRGIVLGHIKIYNAINVYKSHNSIRSLCSCGVTLLAVQGNMQPASWTCLT